MYKDILKEISDKIEKIRSEINSLEKQCNAYKEGAKAIQKLQNEYEKEKGNLAVQKNICPFPDTCNEAESCTKDFCSYDECSNGFCFRRS